MGGAEREHPANTWPDGTPRTIPTFFDAVAGEYPDRTFLLADGATHTYGEVASCSRRLATGLRDLGVGQGDRVAAMLPNGAEFVTLWLAVARLGAVLVPINTAFRQEEAGYILAHAGANALVVTPALLGQLGGTAALPSIWPGRVVLAGEGTEPAPGGVCLLDLAGCPELTQASPVHPADPAVVIYTSGTTGRPKGVLQTHRTYVLTGEAFPWWLGLGEEDRLFTPLPLFHINAQAYSVMGTVGARASVALRPRFSASRFWSEVREAGATQVNALGAIATILLAQPPSPLDRTHGARLCYLAPALAPEQHRHFEERFGVRVMAGYAMSECTFGTITARDGATPLGSMGQPRRHPDPTIEHHVDIVREDGTPCRPGEVGEIVMRGPAVMLGYLHDAASTAEALRDGWLWSGDLAARDAASNFFFVDRKKDLIRRRGENVSSVEVENVLLRHPGVAQAAVVPAPSELTDEEIMAFVVLQSSAAAAPEDLRAWCADHLAAFKVPEQVHVVDSLPVNASGKIAKQELKARLRASAGGVTPGAQLPIR